jgi:hypothetical protein
MDGVLEQLKPSGGGGGTETRDYMYLWCTSAQGTGVSGASLKASGAGIEVGGGARGEVSHRRQTASGGRGRISRVASDCGDDGLKRVEYTIDGGITSEAVRTRCLQNVADVRSNRAYHPKP